MHDALRAGVPPIDQLTSPLHLKRSRSIATEWLRHGDELIALMIKDDHDRRRSDRHNLPFASPARTGDPQIHNLGIMTDISLRLRAELSYPPDREISQ